MITSDGTPGGDPVAWHTATVGKNASSTLYLLPDHLRSLRAVVDPAGSLVQTTDYTPYGQIQHHRNQENGALPRPLGYANGEEEPMAGLVLMGRRPYAPWLGRFLSRETLDDIRRQGMRALARIDDPADPPSQRIPAWATCPYMYAANSPLWVVDIDGRQPKVAPSSRKPDREMEKLKALDKALKGHEQAIIDFGKNASDNDMSIALPRKPWGAVGALTGAFGWFKDLFTLGKEQDRVNREYEEATKDKDSGQKGKKKSPEDGLAAPKDQPKDPGPGNKVREPDPQQQRLQGK